LLFFFNAACLTEKQQIPILKSLVWSDQASNPQSIALEASTLTITPQTQSEIHDKLSVFGIVLQTIPPWHNNIQLNFHF
jgi:hypothetical protein